MVLSFQANIFNYAVISIRPLSVNDFLLFQLNDKNPVCFAVLLLYIILISGYKAKNESNALLSSVTHYSLISLLFLATIVMGSILISLFFEGGSVNTESIILNKKAALFDIVILLILIYFRILATSFCIEIIDRLLNKPYGMLTILLLNIIDYNFYYYSGLEHPIRITAIENTLLTYESIANIDCYKSNLSLSLLYWGIVITLLIVLFIILNRKKLKAITIRPFWASIFTCLLFSSASFFTMKRIMDSDNTTYYCLDYYYSSIMSFNIFLNTYAPLLAITASSSYTTLAKKHSHYLLEYVKKGIKGGSSIVISVLLMLMIVSVFSPVSVSTHIMFRGTFSFASNALLYLLLYFVNCFLVGFAYAGLGYSVSLFTNDILLPYIIPQYLYLFRLFYPFKSGFLLHIIPIDTYDIAGKTRPLYEHVISIVLILFLSFLLLCYNEYKHRKTRKVKKENSK